MKTLKRLRNTRGWTQQKLASVSGVSQTYISELEGGKKQPTVAIALKLANALGETLSSLVETETAEQQGR